MPARRKLWIAFFIAAAVFLFFPEKVLAEVFINEFSSYGDSDWVEIYRTKSENLSFYKLEDAVGNIKELSWSDCSGDFCVVDWYNKLNNSGDTIKLILLPTTVIDQITYGNQEGASVEAPQSGQSAGRIVDGIGDWVIFSSPTKGSSNTVGSPLSTPMATPSLFPSSTPTLTNSPTPTNTPTPKDYSNIFISEFMAYPESGDEWVELYNDNDFEVNLDGWFIDDRADGGSSPRAISGTIPPKGYKQFYLSSAYLNNDGDDVRLLNGNQNEKDKTSFESSTKGKSWSKDKNGKWCQTEPTPDVANPDCPGVENSSSPTPTPKMPTSTSNPTPTSKPTPIPTLKTTPTATESGEILGETQEATTGFYPLGATEEAKQEEKPTGSNKRIWLGRMFLILGFLVLFGGGLYFWYTQLYDRNGKSE